MSVVEAGGSARAKPTEAIAAVAAAMQPPIVFRIRIAFSFQVCGFLDTRSAGESMSSTEAHVSIEASWAE
jgi:hypothetical protein